MSSKESDSELEYDLTNKSRNYRKNVEAFDSNSSEEEDGSGAEFSSESEGEEGRKFRKFQNLKPDTTSTEAKLLKKRKLEAKLLGVETEDMHDDPIPAGQPSSSNNNSSSNKRHAQYQQQKTSSRDKSGRRMLQINEIGGQEDYQSSSESEQDDIFGGSTGNKKTDSQSDSDSESSLDSQPEIDSELEPDLADNSDLGTEAPRFATKKQPKKPKTPKIEPFNVKDNYEEGKFDEEGNFVWNKKDKNDVYDVWMSGIRKKDIKGALRAQSAKREKQLNDSESSKKSSISLFDGTLPTSEAELKSSLAFMLRPGENAFAALARLQKLKKDATKTTKKKSRKLADTDPAIIATTTKQILRITEVCEKLVESGHIECYEWTGELIAIKLGTSLDSQFSFLSDEPPHTEPLPSIIHTESAGLLDDLHSTFDNTSTSAIE